MMNRIALYTLLLLGLLIWPVFNQTMVLNGLSRQELQEGWRLLFNGVDMHEWKGVKTWDVPHEAWVVSNGEMICIPRDERAMPGRGGDIHTKSMVTDFEFSFEFMYEKGANGGIKYTVQPGTTLGFEYQILDGDREDGSIPKWTTADLYDLKKAENAEIKPAGIWNSGKIVLDGARVEHWLNGKKVLELDRFSNEFEQAKAASKFKDLKNFGQHPFGHILLQDHGGGTHYRNLKIR